MMSDAVVEACVGSAVTIDKSAPVFLTPSISRQKWVEEQFKLHIQWN